MTKYKTMSRNVLSALYICGFLFVSCQSEAVSTNTATNEETKVISTQTQTALPTITFTPTIPPSIIELEGTVLPAGFSIIKFAEISRPTAFTFDAQGQLYVTSTDSNVYILTDTNKDGRADNQSTFATGYEIPLGITYHPPTGEIYVSYRGGVKILSDVDANGSADAQRTLVSNLPSFGLHQNDNIKFGPDGWLYMGQGSTCDACKEIDPRNASILRFNIETGESEIYATGMRNPFDIAFHPSTGQLFATDNGRDDLGMDAPSEELNLITQNGDYGFPDCWDSQSTPECAYTIPAIALFEPHSSANGLDFNGGNNFPIEYQNNAFVSIFGSWLKSDVQTGISRVVINQVDGKYQSEVSWFVKFPKGVMPLPLLFAPDGSLYVGDYINGAIYRISYGTP